MTERGKNIYCVIPEEREMRFSESGIEGEGTVYTVNYKDIAAVVSDTSCAICAPTRKNMTAHNRVLEALLNDYTVIPARFGLISDSTDKLVGLLARYYAELQHYLQMIHNRMEVGVKVFWKQEKMLSILETKSKKLADLQREIKKASPARAQAMLVQAGMIVKSQAEGWQTKYGDAMYLSLMRIAIDGKRNYPVDITNILNASFLVNKAQEPEFSAAIDELNVKHGDWADFRYVRPVPAYNFVSLEMYLQ